jgi:hypothetical protein
MIRSQIGLQSLQPQRIRILPGRNSEKALERALQVKGTRLQFLRQQRQGHRRIQILLDDSARPLDHFDLRGDTSGLFRTATAAGPESGALGGVRQRKKQNVVTPGPA